MASCQVLFFLGMILFVMLEANAAPISYYDQRQDGQYNVHAKLDNFLFLIAVPSNKNLLTEFASQALELKQRLASRSSDLSEEHELDATSSITYKSDDENRSKEPYSLEIIRIKENHPDKGKERSAEEEEEDTETLKITDQPIAIVITDEQSQNIDKRGKSLRNLQYVKSQEIPTVLGYLVDMRKMVESNDRARNVIGNIWNLDLDARKSGTFSKGQLFLQQNTKRGEIEEHIASSLNTEKNDVASSSSSAEETTLLDDGSENCGPEGYRDTSGVCQFGKSASSLL